jgi:hypothetical protein
MRAGKKTPTRAAGQLFYCLRQPQNAAAQRDEANLPPLFGRTNSHSLKELRVRIMDGHQGVFNAGVHVAELHYFGTTKRIHLNYKFGKQSI